MSGSTWIGVLRELGLVSPVPPAVASPPPTQFHQPVLEGVFEPDDLEAIQGGVGEACRQRDAHSPEHRAAVATVLFDAWKDGERDRRKLTDIAMAAAL